MLEYDNLSKNQIKRKKLALNGEHPSVPTLSTSPFVRVIARYTKWWLTETMLIVEKPQGYTVYFR